MLIKAIKNKLNIKFQKDIVICRFLDDPIQKFKLMIPVGIRKATMDDLEELSKFKERRSIEIFRQWIKSNFIFYVALKESEIVSYGCVAPRHVNPVLAKIIKLKAGEAWGVDIFTSPSYRSMGIYPAVLNEVMKAAKKRGHNKILATVNIDNHIARKIDGKLGFKAIKQLTRVQILNHTFQWFSKYNGKNLTEV